MACVTVQYVDHSQSPEPWPPYYRRGRRPALIPADCSLTPSEAEELVRTRTQEPLFPPPDSRFLQKIKPASPLESSIGLSENESYILTETSALTRSTISGPDEVYTPIARRIQVSTFLKARAQSSPPTSSSTLQFAKYEIFPAAPSRNDCLRKRSAFVIEQERQVEARADTPHTSELLPGEDEDGDAVMDDSIHHRITKGTMRAHRVTSNPDEEQEH